jgi:hypothetical protein
MERRQGSLRSEAGGEALTPLYQTPTQSPVIAALLPSVCPVAAFYEALALPIGGRPKQGLKTAGVGE